MLNFLFKKNLLKKLEIIKFNLNYVEYKNYT